MLRMIYEALEVEWPTDEQQSRVKVADLRMLATEKRQFLANPDEDWPVLAGVVPFSDMFLKGLDARCAEAFFKRQFDYLYK
jgi:hypothetical protein